MNNSALAGIIVGAVVVAAAGSFFANSDYNPLQKYATVVAVEPAFNTTRTPRQVCGDEATQAPADGATAAAPPAETSKAEAAAMSPAGAKADASATEAGPCVVVYDTSSVQSGYDVTYELDGIQKVVRMDHAPGKRIPVEDGELVVTLR